MRTGVCERKRVCVRKRETEREGERDREIERERARGGRGREFRVSGFGFSKVQQGVGGSAPLA